LPFNKYKNRRATGESTMKDPDNTRTAQQTITLMNWLQKQSGWTDRSLTRPELLILTPMPGK